MTVTSHALPVLVAETPRSARRKGPFEQPYKVPVPARFQLTLVDACLPQLTLVDAFVEITERTHRDERPSPCHPLTPSLLFALNQRRPHARPARREEGTRPQHRQRSLDRLG